MDGTCGVNAASIHGTSGVNATFDTGTSGVNVDVFASLATLALRRPSICSL